MAVLFIFGCWLTGCSGKHEKVSAPEGVVGDGELEGTIRETYSYGDNDGPGEYYVILPDQYDPGKYSYPSVYLMPYDGFHAGTYIEDGIAEYLAQIMQSEEAMDFVVILPAFLSGQDYDAMLPALVEDVETKYAVLSDARYRGILGANVGGYMAYEATLIGGSDLFYCVGAHMGAFAADTNPYRKKGSIAEAVKAFDKKPDCGYEYLSGHFFYLDAPNDDPATTAEGGSSEIGGGLQKRTNPLYQYGSSEYDKPDNTYVDFAVLDGRADRKFYLTYLSRSLGKYSECFTNGFYTAKIQPKTRTVACGEESLSGTVSVSFKEELSGFARQKEQAKITVIVADAEKKTEVASQEFVVSSKGESVSEFSILREDLGDLETAKILCRISLLGMEREVDEQTVVFLKEQVADGERSFLDLRGDWYFKAYKEYVDQSKNELDSIKGITPGVYESWNVIQPAFGWWDASFDESLQGDDNFAGFAWYVRRFELDPDFSKENLKLAVGYFDEANEVYVNGRLVGSTGMEFIKGIGVYDGSNPWDVKCVYDIDSSVLRYGKENTIAIRMCNSTGGGGWYDGPIGLYTEHSYAVMEENAGNRRFFTATYQPSVLNGVETAYRIYLPKDYMRKGDDNTYPVMFLLHGINSTGKSFEIDGIQSVLDEAIEKGQIDPMIVVMPDDPSKRSFWMGKYEKMVTKDLWQEITSGYRVSEEVSRHYVAGCSMGGAGAMHIGLKHPELFGGIISFYGAFPYTDVEKLATKMTKEQLAGYRLWMACGNEDLYDFYEAQENFSRLLTEKGVKHYHTVEDGIHGSSFYLPQFVKAVRYVQGK